MRNLHKGIHAAFFNHYQFDAMTYMPDEIILARMMTTLDVEFKRALHYHDDGYESDNDYGLPPKSQSLSIHCFHTSFKMTEEHVYIVYTFALVQKTMAFQNLLHMDHIGGHQYYHLKYHNDHCVTTRMVRVGSSATGRTIWASTSTSTISSCRVVKVPLITL